MRGTAVTRLLSHGSSNLREVAALNHSSLKRVSASPPAIVMPIKPHDRSIPRMQRLFFMLPTGGPGVALLLLRVALSVLLLHGVLAPLSRVGAHWVLLVPWGSRRRAAWAC